MKNLKEICQEQEVGLGALNEVLHHYFVSRYTDNRNDDFVKTIISMAAEKRTTKLTIIRNFIAENPGCTSRDMPIKRYISATIAELISRDEIEVCGKVHNGVGRPLNMLRIKD